MITRRSFALAPAAWLAAHGVTAVRVHGAPSPSDPPSGSTGASRGGAGRAEFPAQSSELVREAVVAAHGNIARLRTLVGRQQTLAKASYDWGFGDWESALAGASHVGHREIADYLIANGAQPTIFSAAMLGQLEVVKAFVAASPGVQQVPGPHSISLLRHAQAGGAAARAVVEYLTALGDADPAPPRAPLSPEQMTLLAGSYAVDSVSEPVVIAPDGAHLTFGLAGRSRRLHHRGSLEFSPTGAANVRIVFAAGPDAVVLTVRDPDEVLRGRKAVKQ